MARTFVDDDLLQWEAYPSGGPFGLPDEPVLVFHCRSDLGRRARYVRRSGDEADAEQEIRRMDETELRELFRRSQPIA